MQVEIKDIDQWIDKLMECKYLTENEIFLLCEKVKELLSQIDNIERVRTPITICGDIHG